MHQAAVSFALVASGLLLATALFTDVQEGIEDLEDPFLDRILQEAPPEDLSAHAADLPPGSLERLLLDEDLELVLPAGTHVTGDELVLSESLALTLPAGSNLHDFDGMLPAGTHVQATRGSTARDDVLHLAAETLLILPAGIRLILSDGGTLRGLGETGAQLRNAIRDGEYTTTGPSRLDAHVVHVLDAWNVRLSEGTRIQLGEDWRPPAGWRIEDGRLAEDTAVTFPSGTPMQGGPPLSGSHTGTSGSPVTWETRPIPGETPDEGDPATQTTTETGAEARWEPPGWLIGLTLLAIAAGAALLLATRRRATLASAPRRTSGLALTTRIDTRAADLPLAIGPGGAATLHYAILAAPHPGAPASAQAARATTRLDGARVARGTIPAAGAQLPLRGLPRGEHELELRVRTRRLARARRLHAHIRVADWPEQVARDWQDLVDALGAHVALPAGATPRQVRGALAAIAPEAEARLGQTLVSLFEESNYSPRGVGEREWLDFALAAREARAALKDATHATTKTPRAARNRTRTKRTPHRATG